MPEDTMSAAAAATDILTVGIEFDIFEHKPIQTSVFQTTKLWHPRNRAIWNF
jgi:hypothetical protein